MTTALLLSPPRMLTTPTRAGLEGLRRILPGPPYPQPVRGQWGLLVDSAIPDVVIAEHADPLLVAMLCADLLPRARLLDKRIVVLIGGRDDALRQLLAPLPLPLTVLSPAMLRRAQPLDAAERAVCWVGVSPPRPMLPRWAVVPLMPALARAGSVAEAAAWCGMARSTAYDILTTTAQHLQLPRRWRTPRQWSRDLVAALSRAPDVWNHAALSAVGDPAPDTLTRGHHPRRSA